MFVKVFSQTDDQSTEQIERKVWVCLFTCFTVRAVHLELVEDMSTDEFLFCLCRFIARQGAPQLILSDNAKQFKAASTVLEKAWRNVMTDERLNEFVSNQGIQWKFTVELAPWMGDFMKDWLG